MGMLDQQYGVMLNQSFNMEQVSFTLSNAKDTVETVKAMKAATTELKRAFKEDINLDELDLDATNSVPDYIPEAPNGPAKASVPAAITNDEFGLPVAPTMTTS